VTAEGVLYADVLFLINFSMDFLSLYAAGRLLSLRCSAGRMSAAAAIGAVWGVAAAAFSFDGWGGAVGAVLCSAVMTAAAFGIGEGWRGFLRAAFAVWGSGALIGGFMTLFSGLFGGALPGGGFADMAAAVPAVIFGFGRLARRQLSRGYAEVRIPCGENVYEGRALIDSGNLLTDPLSGVPVILMRAAEARELVGDEADGRFCGRPASDGASRGGVRVVPARSAEGTRLLYGFFCTDVTVRRGRCISRRQAVICVDHAADSYGGCGVLLPAALLP